MENNNLIDRYVYEVSRHLPATLRDDVGLELRSTLQDMAEARGLQVEEAEDQKALAGMLKEFGPPRQVAASFRPNRYLVSPRAFPFYEMVLKIVLSVIGVLFALLALVGIASGGSLWGILAGTLTEFAGSVLSTFAIITIIFYLLERTGGLKEEIEEEEDWDPLDLPEIQEPERIKRGELIAEVVFTIIALIVFNFFLDRIGIPVIRNGEAGTLPLFAEDLQRFVPMLSTVWSLEIALAVYVLNQGYWESWTRIGKVLISAASIGMLYIVVTQATIVELSIVDWVVKGALWIVIVISSLDVLGQIYKLVFPAREPIWKRSQRAISS